MSNVPVDPTTQQQQQKGQETFLSPEERAQLKRLMGHPTDYPKELGAWVTEFLKVNPPEVSATQIRGSRGAPRFIGADAELVSVSSTSAETTVYTQKIPGRTIGKNGHLTAYLFFTSRDDSGNALPLHLAFKLGNTSLAEVVVASTWMDATYRSGAAQFVLTNGGGYSSQFGLATGAYSGQALLGTGSGAVDSSQDQDFKITARWETANADNVFRKYYASVEVFNPIGV